MRIKRKITIALLGILLISILSGCGKKADVSSENEQEKKENNGKVELNVWSHFGGLDTLISDFESKNPNIKINLKVMGYDEYVLKYKESMMLDEGEADVFVIDSTHYGEYNSMEGLEDLLKPEYNIMDYRGEFDNELWELGKSMDKSKLLGLPIASAPIVTYYRKDIMEKNGFPGEPEELAEFMSDSKNWLKIGEKLKNNGISIFQWYSEIVRIHTSNTEYFNDKLEYQKNNEDFKKALEITMEAKKLGLAAFNDIWSDSGKELLKNDKFAMLYLGSWGSDYIKSIAPEQAGLWRVTSLPFGVYGWNNATLVSMAENSTKKEEAWKFIEHYAFKFDDTNRFGNVSGYKPFRNTEKAQEFTNDFLGGQKEQKLYEDVMSKTEEYCVTALDDKAFSIWDHEVNIGLENEYSIDKIVMNIQNEINKQLGEEIEILKRTNKIE